MFARKPQHRAVAGGFERIAGGHFAARASRENARSLPSDSSDRLLQHVVDGLAVEHAARAARIVGHHAADGGAAGGRDIRREAQPERRQLRIQLVEHDARLDARPALLRIHFQQRL